jgi:hypothetical protein
MKWNSLTQLKEHFERTELKTTKFTYGLAFGQLSRRDNERPKTKAK